MALAPVIVVLGRNGDVLNALPIAHELFRRGQRPMFLISKACAGILNAVSYVDPMIWDGDYSQPAQAIMWFKRHHGQHPLIVAQCYMHADQRHQTDSYQKESWRVAGWRDRFGTLPLVLDRRSPEREEALVEKFQVTEKTILVAPDGISSKYAKADELVKTIREKFPDRHILDLREVRAEQVYDLLGLMDEAAVLVSVDTVHLHLARIAKIPLIAITNDDWRGSVCPPNTWERFTYGSEISYVIGSLEYLLETEKTEGRIIHVADLFGTTERHQRAQATWKTPAFFPVMSDRWARDSSSVGDDRKLPFLKDVLKIGLAAATRDEDIILWTNDDVGLADGIVEWCQRHVGRWGAASMRRDSTHMGRDLFAFQASWLRSQWEKIPDFLLGAPFWDLCLAAVIRNTCRVNTTMENLKGDIFPCETEDRLAIHEDHPSEWQKGEFTYPANLHNRKLFLEWAKAHCPTLKL